MADKHNVAVHKRSESRTDPSSSLRIQLVWEDTSDIVRLDDVGIVHGEEGTWYLVLGLRPST